MGSHHPIRKTVAPEPVTIPDKLYFRIGDVARLCQVPAYVLRFWETEFPSLKPNKGGTGQRLYRRKDVEMALRIKDLLYDQGYTIPGARQVFKSEAKPRETDSTEPSSFSSAPALSLSPAPALTISPSLKATGFGPAETNPSPQAASADPGEAIRRQAHLRALRDDLHALLIQLGGPLTPAAPEPAPPPAKPSRPRLVLEPRPAKPSPPAHNLQQRDLFAIEPTEFPETLE